MALVDTPVLDEARRAELARLRARDRAERRVALSTRPAHVTLEMTARCNLVCVHCRRFHVHTEVSDTRGAFGQAVEHDVVGASGYLSDDVYARSLDLVRDADWVSLTGYGEPMMHPRYFEFLDDLKARGHVVDSISNGTLLSQQNVDRLVEKGLDQLSVSIDGVEGETLRVVRGVDADEVFAGVERLAKAKAARGLGREDAPRISVNFTMARFNVREMPRLARKLVDLGLHVFYAHPLDVSAWPEALGPQLVYTDPGVRAEAQRLVEVTEAICREHGVATDICRIPHAGSGHEPPGVPLDRAFEALKAEVEANPAPPRTYLPLGDIEERRRHLAAAADPAPAPELPADERAGDDALSEAEWRENERCLDFFRYAFVAWNGKVLSCCMERHAVGDLNLQDADDVWNGEAYRRIRRGFYDDGLRWVCHGCAKILD